MTHTPGPWVLNHNTNWKTNPFSVTVSKYGVHSTTVANIPTRMTIPPEEQEANARLIAAAPDLLGALHKLLNDVEAAVDFGCPFDDPDNNFHESVTAARAAIAKATGEA